MDDPGSHPGPLSFWLLAPVYNLLGGSSFALQTATAVFHLAGFGAALWLAARRGGVALVLAVGAVLAVLERFFGTLVLVEPWNPYLPTSWWMVLLLASWSVLDDDIPALPLFILAGSICAQTHLPYVGLVGGLILCLVAVAGYRWLEGRRRQGIASRPGTTGWILGSIAFGAVLWAAPIWDQFRRTGNLSLVMDTLQNPNEAPVGLRAGLEAFLSNLDPTTLVTWTLPIDGQIPGSPVIGAMLALGFFAVAALTWSGSDRRARSLQVVVGTALLLGLVSAVKVTGEIWYYLYLWARTVGGFAVLAMAVALWTRRSDGNDRPPAEEGGPPSRVSVNRPVLNGVGAVAIAVTTIIGGIQAADGPRSQPVLTADLGELSDQAAAALDPDGSYLVIWTDRLALGGQGIGLVNELERRGFHVGVTEQHGAGAVRHRVMSPSEVDGIVHVVVGDDVEAYEADHPDAVAIASIDHRSQRDLARYDEILRSIEEFYETAENDAPTADPARDLFITVVFGDLPSDLVRDAGEAIRIATSRASIYLEPPAS